MIIEQIIETKHFIMIRYSHFEGKNGFVLVDKSTQESLLSYWEYEQYGSIVNDIDGGPRFFPNTVVNDSTMVMWAEATDLKYHIASDDFKNAVVKYPEKKQKLRELADNLAETDNPVLMVIKVKSNK